MSTAYCLLSTATVHDLRFILAAAIPLAYNPINMPILDPNSVEFLSRSAEQTRRVGMRLGAILQTGDVLCLEGDLGSGKTTLVQGIAAGWGSLDMVSSPTYVLVNIYRRTDDQQLAHLDAYRLESADQADALDLDALLQAGPLVVEWPQRIKNALPTEHIWVDLDWIDEEQRGMQFSAVGDRNKELLEKFQESMFGAA
ncbi:MAG: tRNA (adenosine(37)-N6)-threonylcarbamoyltransferase complex ATPase subunit type 1 TsaE [Anaerolineae bacterium]|nr:tRNA (adenosine(37)-N6)-threonylcarbamoyltransferase complex ATPase subunit type 1 TsaE [Anaerolineae bacterium]